MPLVVDTFTGADASPLSGSWLKHPYLGGMKLQGNMARPTASSTDSAVRYTGPEVLGNDHYAQATIGQGLNTTSGDRVTVYSRMSPTANTYYAFRGSVHVGTGQLRLYKVVAGAQTQLALVTLQCQVGDTLRLEVQGTSIKGTHNRGGVITTVGPVTDPAIATGGVGVGAAQFTDARVDNFQADTLIGSLPPARTVTEPIYDGETVVSGLGSAGLTVEVTRTDVVEGTLELVGATGGWSHTFGTALSSTGNETVKVRQKSLLGLWGPFSATAAVKPAVSKPPAMTGSLYAGGTDIIGLCNPNAPVEIFKGGVSQGSVTADANGLFRFTGPALVATNIYTAKQTVGGTESGASPSVTVVAAPTGIDAYMTTIGDQMTVFGFTRTDADTDDIRRAACRVLATAAIDGSTTHQIKNALFFLLMRFAKKIWNVNG